MFRRAIKCDVLDSGEYTRATISLSLQVGHGCVNSDDTHLPGKLHQLQIGEDIKPFEGKAATVSKAVTQFMIQKVMPAGTQFCFLQFQNDNDLDSYHL